MREHGIILKQMIPRRRIKFRFKERNFIICKLCKSINEQVLRATFIVSFGGGRACLIDAMIYRFFPRVHRFICNIFLGIRAFQKIINHPVIRPFLDLFESKWL